MLDSVYHGVLRFITNCGFLTHHCTLYSIVNWTALSTRWLGHWYIFIYKSILRKTPDYLSSLLILKDGTLNLRSLDFVQFVIPKVRTELGKKSFRFSAPFAQYKKQYETINSMRQYKRKQYIHSVAGYYCTDLLHSVVYFIYFFVFVFCFLSNTDI